MEIEETLERAASCCEENDCFAGARVKLVIALDEERRHHGREETGLRYLKQVSGTKKSMVRGHTKTRIPGPSVSHFRF